jgi:two-component system alkaline phosphatase synthesis response regulator PhoP
MMRLNGFRVIKTYSSTPAMSIIREEKPDLILLDIMMPEISGIEILHLMRSDPVLALIPVVVISARATPTDVQTGLDAGASIYLTKPVGYMDLKNAVDRLLQGT